MVIGSQVKCALVRKLTDDREHVSTRLLPTHNYSHQIITFADPFKTAL